jgi:hypothetical protein
MNSARIDNIQDIPRDQQLYIFGAALGGRLLLSQLRSSGHDNIVGFIDDVAASAPRGLHLQTSATFLQSAPPGALVLVASEHFEKISKIFEGADVVLYDVMNIIWGGVAYDQQKAQERLGVLLSWLPRAPRR